MPILAWPELPFYLKFHRHDHDHKYKSLVPFFSSYHFPVINNPCKFNAKHKALLSAKASNNSDQPDNPDPDPAPAPAPVPVPATTPSSAWKNWMVGIILSIVLPSYRHKHTWAPLLELKNKVDTTIETVESVAEAVEEFAEGVEKVADEISDKLPDDSELKEPVELIENQAKQAVETANLVEELVDMVQEAEKKLESEFTDQAKIEEPKQS